MSGLLLLQCFFSMMGAAQSGATTGAAIPVQLLDNLIQGRWYVANYFPIRGNPFLNQNLSTEDVQLLDIRYKALPLWYDIYIDELILSFNQGAEFRYIQLNKEQIRHFDLEGRHFINLAYSPYRDMGLRPGYYEVAFQDKIVLLVKRKLEVKADQENLRSYFSRADIRILIKDEQHYSISNRSSLMEAVGPDLKKEMAAFIKRNKIRFKKAGDAEWLQMITYLNELQTATR